MKITYYNHASMSIRSNSGFEILTDPWIYGPIYGGSMWQFPTCKIDLKNYYKKDAIYISHTHPDHFCINTLKGFSKKIPIYIRKYDSNVPMKKILIRNGFKNVFEIDHKQKVEISKNFFITLVHDKNTVDSLIICENDKKTFLMQNDCFLSEAEYKWISKNFKIDLAGVFFMGIGPMPGAFNLPWSEKEKIVTQKKKDNFLRAAKTVKLIKAKKIFSCSNDMIWYKRPDLAFLNGALPKDFKKFMDKKSKTKTLLLQSKDFYDLKKNKLFNKNSLDMYNTKQDQLKEYFKIFYNKKMMDHKNNLDKWENSFKFQSSKFSRLFNSYLDTLKNNKNLINVSAKFKVGFRITNNDEEELFIFKMINKKKPILVKCNNINDLYDKSHMVLQIKGSLIEMAVTGAYSFEDLFNCSYIIDRFHKPFNISEKSFWKIFTEFGWFLVGSKYQKKENQLLRYQLLTSNL